MSWQPILPNVYLYADSCNVYAIIGPQGALIIDSGTGEWLDYLDELPAPPVACQPVSARLTFTAAVASS